ncbi:TRAP transporter substrate-binding protein DctP [Desulfatitalea alkaliphila]|uniref:TRAP transporter substrate-binding protein DctP n=1 Tax=Desulfatitalea alkaliphila TaxID=2929485 RepID=A0AA41R1R1_9BACT|nr:TRAP transporter substrate-binding protein DctP [Desulfatitalea alkaliphila]MCJ8500869.1 TRAP transporter substrate-binding protein DctP [Desulfatitalea alkaliphila]
MCKRILAATVITLVVFAFVFPPAHAAEKVFRWKYQQMRIAAEPGMAYYKEMFEKTLPAMTNGRLKVQMFWGGDLVKSTDALDAVQSGIVEMIGMPSIYFKGVIPEASIEYGLPFGIRTPYEMYNFMYGKDMPNMFGGWRAIDVYRKIYAKHGVHYLAGGVDCWPAAFMFRSPINSIGDIKGKKVRASGLMISWIERLGGQGVFIPGEEAYSALQTGAIDGITWGGAMGMHSMKFHEVAKYYLYPSLMPINHLTVLVNQKAWDALPEDLQVALEQAVVRAGMDITAHQNWSGEQWGLRQMAKAGVTINHLTGEDLKKAEEVAYGLWEEEAQKSPEAAELVGMMKDYMRTMGYME